MPTWDNPLITIIGEKCRMCYACVRECPAKAIRVVDGQASVIQPRCIGCGNCLRVCSQNAKQVRDDTERAFALLESGDQVAAMVAPSFPAEFTDISAGHPGGDDPGARLRLGARGVARAPIWWPRSTAGCSRRTRTSATSPPLARPWSRTCASTIPA